MKNEVTDRCVSLCGQIAVLASYDRRQHLSGVLGEQVWSLLLTDVFGQL